LVHFFHKKNTSIKKAKDLIDSPIVFLCFETNQYFFYDCTHYLFHFFIILHLSLENNFFFFPKNFFERRRKKIMFYSTIGKPKQMTAVLLMLLVIMAVFTPLTMTSVNAAVDINNQQQQQQQNMKKAFSSAFVRNNHHHHNHNHQHRQQRQEEKQQEYMLTEQMIRATAEIPMSQVQQQQQQQQQRAFSADTFEAQQRQNGILMKISDTNPTLMAARRAAEMNRINENVPVTTRYTKSKSSLPSFSSRAFAAVNGTIGMTGLFVDVVLSPGTPLQNTQVYIDNTGGTAIGSTYEFPSGGFNNGASSSLTYPNVCGSTPCVATKNSTITDFLTGYGFSGPVVQDSVGILQTNSSYLNTTGRFVLVTSSSGGWPFNSGVTPPVTDSVGVFGLPANTTVCYGSTCFLDYYGAVLAAHSLPNLISLCVNYSRGAVVSIGLNNPSLYTGAITYVSTAAALNVTVPVGFEDSVVVKNITFNGVDLTGGNSTLAGPYSTLNTNNPQMLLPNSTYYLLVAGLTNALDSTLAVGPSTPHLVDIFYDALADSTAAQRRNLPSINFSIQQNGAGDRVTWAIPSDAYMLEFQIIDENGLLVTEVIPAFNVSSTGYAQLNLPAIYSKYTILDRANTRVGFATFGATQCTIGCASLTTESSCRAQKACGFCLDPLTMQGRCVEGTPYGPSAPTLNENCLAWRWGPETPNGSVLVSPTSFAAVLLGGLGLVAMANVL